MGDEQHDKMMGMPLSQKQTNYTTVSPTAGEKQCANCRWYIWRNYGGDYGDISGCHLIESWPLPVLPTGLCDRWEENVPEVYEPMPLEVVIVGDETKALALTPRHIGGLERRARQLAGKVVDGMRVVHTEKGRIGIIYTSNGYVDRDNEAVAQKALEKYVEGCWKDDAFVGDNILLWWHTRQLGPVGDVIWAGMVEGFLCELFEERPTPVAKMVWDWWEGEADPGASHGFYADETRIEAGGVVKYTDIDKRETTVLPRRYAANGITFSGVMKMTDVKMQYLARMFKQQGVEVDENELATLLKAGPKAINDKLAAAGVIPKERKSEGEPKPALNYDALMASLIDGQAELASDVDTVKQELQSAQGEVKVLKQGRSDDAQKLKSLEDDNEKLHAQLSLTPRRAAEAPETALDDAEVPDAVKKQLEQTQTDPFWGTVVPKA